MKTTIVGILSLMLGLLLGKFLFSAVPEEEKVLVLVNGTAIKEKDIAEQTKGDVEILTKNIYDIKKRAALDLAKAKGGADAKLEWKMTKPTNKSVSVPKGILPRLGPLLAPVTLVVFTNYQCPYCLEAERRLNELKEKYKDKLQIYHRFTLDEPDASLVFRAAEASFCANEQGKFWQYRDLLAQTKPIDEATLVTTAQKAELDLGNFEKCLKSGQQKTSVKKDMEEAMKLGVSPTSPVFFINGHKSLGALNLEALSEIVDSEL